MAFERPSGWTQVRGGSEGTPAQGQYAVRRDLGSGATCTLSIEVLGVAVRQPPKVERGRLVVRKPTGWTSTAGLRITAQSSSRAAYPWYRVASWMGRYAGFAVIRTPAFVRSTRPTIVVGAFLRRALDRRVPVEGGVAAATPTAAQRRRCSQEQASAARTTLTRVISGAQVFER